MSQLKNPIQARFLNKLEEISNNRSIERTQQTHSRYVESVERSTVDDFIEGKEELGLSPSVPVHAVLHDWIRQTDGKLNFLGFIKLLHGVSSRTLAKAQQKAKHAGENI
ncbi:hypothetical protein Vadar_014582 [Vaccinium darrowii]|uniref:Uncharacterized protein n=1 Tax=Vaccinium darrowii TaxID=229202 RepID=A0ACB7X0U0_9ERIC|nr:hypothetical protein Vadar_014582 [Vaccinium darrowii]